MQSNWSDFLLVSDLDGTLIDVTGTIPWRNIQALRYFVNHGGRFTIATGRSFESAKPYIKQLPITEPAIVFNGACIYHYQTEKVIYEQPLSKQAFTYVKDILNHFSFRPYRFLREYYLYIVLKSPWAKMLQYPISELMPLKIDEKLQQEKLYKVILSSHPEHIKQIHQYVNQKQYPGVYWVQTSMQYLEMMSEGTGKGIALQKLGETLKINPKHIVAIGDYYNDMDLLRAAGISACPKDSAEEVKEMCDIIVCPCQYGAVAELVEYIEKHFIRG